MLTDGKGVFSTSQADTKVLEHDVRFGVFPIHHHSDPIGPKHVPKAIDLKDVRPDAFPQQK